jgi:hypothetical protein
MKIYDITGIGANLTGSFSGSFKEIFTGTATTASYVQYSNVADKPTLVSGSSQIADFGYATTGSNQFDGSQAITGSLTVTGQVVAQTLNVQQVTSSIVYSSGSNIFGNDLGNTQQFTGSVNITGSLTTSIAPLGTAATTFLTSNNGTIRSRTAAQTLSDVAALPLAGGTLTGVLRVDSALRIKSGAANGILLETYNTNELRIRVTPFSTTFDLNLVFPSSSRTYTYPNATGTLALTSDLGAYLPLTGGTLTGALNGTSASFNDLVTTTSVYRIVQASVARGGLYTYNQVTGTGTDYGVGVYSEAEAFIVTGGTTTKRLTIASTGEATFSSSVTASGNITSSNGKFFVVNTFGYFFGDNSNLTGWQGSNGTQIIQGFTGGTERMRITSAGNVGIGTDSPVGKLDVYRAAGGSGTSAIVISNGEGGGRNWALSTEVVTAGDFAILCSSTTGGTPSPSSANSKLYITSGGNVGIGTTSPTEKLHIVAGGAGPEFRMEGAGHSWYIRPYNDNYNVLTPSGRQAVSYLNNGDVRNYNNTTTWQQVSDVRVKENINTIPDAISKILSLNPVIFDYKKEFADKNNWDDNKKINNAGFIAQEFEIIFPKYISNNEFLIGETVVDDFKSIDTGHLVAYLVKAIQELKSENDTLKSILQRNNIS